MINIDRLPKYKVLQALFNNSKPLGMGFYQSWGEPMSDDEAKTLLQEDTDFDYVRGRVMKVDLENDIEFDERLYDRNNGEGAAEAVIAELRLRHAAS